MRFKLVYKANIRLKSEKRSSASNIWEAYYLFVAFTLVKLVIVIKTCINGERLLI